MKTSQRLWRSLLFITLLAALCGSLASPLVSTSVGAAPQLQAASCTTIAGWTFTGNSTSPSTGAGVFSPGSGLNNATFPVGPVTSQNPAVSFSGWTTANSLDLADYIQFQISTIGQKSISLAFDSRISSTGPAKFEVHYSTDGTNFTLFNTPVDSDTGASWDNHVFDLSSITALDDTTDVFIRLYGYSSGQSNGTWRVDNVVFCGTPIVTIDSITPNPTNSGATITWHSLVDGNYTIRLGGTDCTDGTELSAGSYVTTSNQVSFAIDGSALIEGTNTIRVCVIDSSNHINFDTSSVMKETVAPTVIVDRASNQPESTNSLPINFTVTFSEAIDVNTFAVSDITQSGTATGITWTIIDSGDHKIFTLRATAVTGGGTLIPLLAAAKVTDVAGNNNTASTSTTSTSNVVTFAPAIPLTILINEVAWAGTVASPDDEWIELYNPSTTTAVDLTGWVLKSSDNTPNISLTGPIPPNSFLVFARNSGTFQPQPPVTYSVDSTINLSNNGEIISLIDSTGKTIDTANSDGGSWPAGSASPAYASMERVGTANQWITYGGSIPVAYDRAATPNPIKGTPGKPNWISTTTITTITSDAPDPSLINQNITVTVTVVGGMTVPTGTVNITGANTNCAITLSNGTGSCTAKFTSTGAKTITATYGGDGSHPASSDTESHQVNATAATPVRTSTPIPAPPPPLLVINEFVPRPGHDWNQDGIVNVKDEYIEILNHGTINVDLSGYSLDDEVNIGSDPYRLPSRTLKPGERVVFYGSDTGLLLGDGGDGVRLLKPNGQLMDAYNYVGAEYPDQAFCRLPDNGGADDWNQHCYPTPGLQNSLSGGLNPLPGNVDAELICPIADTLPSDFIFAECPGFGYGIWRAEFWDKLGWLGEKILPEIDGRWPVFAD